MFVPSLISLTCHLVLYFASNTVLTISLSEKRIFLRHKSRRSLWRRRCWAGEGGTRHDEWMDMSIAY